MIEQFTEALDELPRLGYPGAPARRRALSASNGALHLTMGLQQALVVRLSDCLASEVVRQGLIGKQKYFAEHGLRCFGLSALLLKHTCGIDHVSVCLRIEIEMGHGSRQSPAPYSCVVSRKKACGFVRPHQIVTFGVSSNLLEDFIGLGSAVTGAFNHRDLILRPSRLNKRGQSILRESHAGLRSVKAFKSRRSLVALSTLCE